MTSLGMRSAGAAVVLSLTVACGGGGFPPPVVAQQPPDAVRGLRVVLEPDVRTPPSFFGEALEKAFTEAGIDVSPSDDMPPPYDFAVGYGRVNPRLLGSARDGVWFILIKDTAVAEYFSGTSGGPRVQNLSWDSRDRASRGGEHQGGSPGPLGLMRACFAKWKVDSQSAGAPGTLSDRTNAATLAVNGPPSEGEPTKETDLGAAYFLVNTVLQCPAFQAMARTIKESGMSASASFESLPPERLVSLCREWSRMGGVDNTAYGERPCSLAVERDPRLAATVQGLRAAKLGSEANADRQYAAVQAFQAREKEQAAMRALAEAQMAASRPAAPAPGVVVVTVPGVPPPAQQTVPIESCSCLAVVCRGAMSAACSATHPGARCTCGACMQTGNYTINQCF